MSTEKEITFVIFVKSIYEVRPKKRPAPKETHHWKLRIEGLKSDKDIKRVEYILHNTFIEPVQVRKKPPFEIEEDGFGNFQMRINVKVLNRIIPLTYFIELHPQKFVFTQFHHSVWLVKPKELEKVLEIGGIPVETFDGSGDESRAILKIWDYVKKNNDRHIDPSYFYPKIYEKVLHTIKRLELSESIPVMMNNTDMDMGQSDDSNSNRHFQSMKQHRHMKQNSLDPPTKMKHRNQEFEIKKELKRKKNQYESSSESDADISHDNLFGRSFKKSDNLQSVSKVNDVKMEKIVKMSNPNRSRIGDESMFYQRPEYKQEIPLSKPAMKPVVKIENKLQKPIQKEAKLKLKIKDANPDSFSKLFDAPDLIVLNKGKLNLAAKEKNDISNSMATSHDGVKRKGQSKEASNMSDHVVDDAARLQKKSLKSENSSRHCLKDSRHSSTKPTKIPDNSTVSKPIVNDNVKKIKPPEKTMPADQKKEKKSDYKSKKLSSSFYKKPLSSLSSSDSELGSISSKSSSDNELDPELFARKKKSTPIDHNKVGVKQLFGDDNDNSDDDDIADLFSALKNSGTKPVTATVKRRKEMSVKSDDDGSSENDMPHNKLDNAPVPQPIDSKSNDKETAIKDKPVTAAEAPNDQMISLKERRKLAKALLKIKNKRFFGKFQRLLLASFDSQERSVSFDPNTLRLDFHMGEVSDELVKSIRAMVDEYLKEHNRTLSNMTNSRGF